MHVLNGPYKHCHSTVSAAIWQCSRFLKNVQNFTHLHILTIITVAIPFTVFICFTLTRKKNLSGHKILYMIENRYTSWNYFIIFTTETSRIKHKPVIGAQLVYKYISNCLLLAEREVHCSLYSWMVAYNITYIRKHFCI